MTQLLPHHLTHLRESGLTDDTIAAAGIYSEDNYQKLGALLNRSRLSKKMAPAIVFQFRQADGSNGYARIRPDTPRRIKGRRVKYESPTGHPNEVYIPPGTFDALDKPTVELLIAEGEKKSLKADQEDFPCLGLVGVFGWKDGRSERLLPSLDRIERRNRQVRIVFDSDLEGNPDIQDAEARLAAQLLNRGAKVRCVRLPDLPNGDRCGLDDFLVAHGQGELRKLLDAAVEPEPVSAIETKIEGNVLDPATEAQELLHNMMVDDLPTLRYWRGSFYRWIGGAYREAELDEIEGAVIRRLNPGVKRLSRAVVGNIVHQLKAQSAIPSRTEPPVWLAGSKPWPADDMLAARNGLLHLPGLVEQREPYQIDHTPRLFVPTALDYDVNIDTPQPTEWLAFLDQLWPDDPRSIELLQDFIGYLIGGSTKQQKILMMNGPKRSGKGTIGRVLTGLLGKENVCSPTLASLGSNFGLQGLIGKSFAIVPDARLSGRSDKAVVIERLLSISGEDGLQIDRKYNTPITLRLPTRLILLTNELPRLSDASGALASRMLLLQMTRSWFGREDPGLTDRLLAELPGILVWSLGGWMRLRDHGRFRQPDSAKDLLGEMADLASPVTSFVNDRCELDGEATVPRAELYESYCEWCKGEGRSHVEDQAGFGRNLKAAFPTIGNRQPRMAGKQVRCYMGNRLRSDA